MAKPHFTLTLTEPLDDTDGGTISAVSIYRPKARALAEIEDITRAHGQDGGKMALGIKIIAVLTGLPEAVIGDLDGDDFNALSEAAEGFFLGNRPVGEPSSPTAPTS